MWDMTPRKVLVGVETAACGAALQAAAEEAQRRGCGVHLMHVMNPVYAGSPEIAELTLIAGELQNAGIGLLMHAKDTLQSLLGDEVVVSTELCHGAVVPSLLDASAHACLVVLQHGVRPGGHTRLLSVTNCVAARAPVPVLAVPDTHVAPASRNAEAVVTCGVHDFARSAGLVHEALREADRRGARLLLVHAVEDTGHDHPGAATQGTWMRQLKRELEADFADLCSLRPRVRVEFEMLSSSATEALLSRASASSVLVVGRRRPQVGFFPHLGPVARGLLRRSSCPVLVIDPVDPPEGIGGHYRDLSSAAVP